MDSKRAVEIIKKLKKEYHITKHYLDFKTPLQLLVAAILSAQVKDETVNAATKELFKKFKTAKDYANASVEKLIKYIKKINFAGNKARNIIKTCKILVKDYKGKVPQNIEELMKLPGIGRKTAVVIMAGAFNKVEGIAVDTHVIRLAYRLGWTKNKDPKKIEQDLMKLIPKKYWHEIQWLLKAHGRKICGRKPKCTECIIEKLCAKQGVDKKIKQ
ncbi:endonuclease III [Candidatus Woesearchaeota archaeon]|nr:MAG: endonuclease III [Candidatus Woesearchaeota archaeon ex4484_78]RLE46179.1 MAG: endonuclease III [Candidatus Woesearchaeota archaeon]